MGWFRGLLAKVFGPKAPQSTLGTTVPENGVDFDYPIGAAPHNTSRNRHINDAALPFTPEEYKKIINEIDARKDLNAYVKEEMKKEVINRNPKWVPGVNTEPKEKLNPSSSAIASLRITPDNKIAIRYRNGSKEYTYTGGATVHDAAKAVLELINSSSIGRDINTKIPGSWGNRHYDAGHA